MTSYSPGGEGWFLSLLNNAADIVTVLAEDDTVLYDSPSIGRTLGYEPGERVGRKGLDYVHPDDAERVRAAFSRLLERPGIEVPLEYRIRHKDGSWRHVEATRTNLLSDPEVGGIVAISRDVTDRKLAERRLEEAEERYRKLVEGVPAAIYMRKGLTSEPASYEVTYMSPRVEEILGYPPERFVEDPGFWTEVTYSEDRGRVVGEDRGADGTGVSFSMEYRMVRNDGRVVWVLDEAAPVGKEEGFAHWQGHLTDISAKREIEEALRESERRHRHQARESSLLHQVRTALSRELDPGDVFDAVVEAVAETYGYVLVSAYLIADEEPQKELVLQRQVGYRSVLERIPLSRGVMARVARSGEPAYLEEAHTDPEFLDAIQGIVSEICVPLFDRDEVIGTLNVESIDGAKLAEEDLRLLEAVGEHTSDALSRARLHARIKEAEERYRALVENVPAVVYIDAADESNSALYRSPFVRDVLGYEPEEFLHDPMFWQNILHPEDRERVLAENERTNGTGEPFRIEYRMIRKDGRAVWLRDEAVLIRDDEGRPRFWQGYFADVTERKLAEERIRETEAKYRTIVEGVPAVTYVHAQNPGGTSYTSYISPQIEAILGYTPAEYTSDPEFWKTVLHPEDRERVLAEDVRTGQTGEPFRLEFRMVAKDGRIVWLREDGRLISKEGETEVWHGVMFDITEFKRTEMALKESEERYRKLVELSPEPIAVHDGERLLFINRAGAQLFGAASPEDLVGRKVLDFVHPAYRALVSWRVRHTLKTGDRAPLLEEKYLRLDGGVLDLEVVGQPITYSGRPAVQAVLRDVTGRKLLEERLAYRATHDSLTGLPNRALLTERLERCLLRTRRGIGRVALLFMDIDNFKVVNDSLGHDVGDRLLVAVGRRLEQCLRPEDTVARLGGDEFVVLLEEENAGAAEKAAARIAEALGDPFVLDGQEAFVTVSIGISSGEGGAKDPSDLLREADLAMYRAKRGGRASYAVFEPFMEDQARTRLSLENDLRRALERGQFRLHYQPIIRIETGEAVGAEALLRWKHPKRGLLAPRDFLQVAEETGLIVPIGRWVLRETCRQIRAWWEEVRGVGPDIRSAGGPFRININVSLRQLRDADFTSDVARAVAGTVLPPDAFTLELTEDDLVGETSADLGVLRELKGIGVGLAIDDFGTGYSSLSSLGQLPVDQLKLDRSIVAGVKKNRANAAIVSATVALAESLGLGLVAEGVETEDERSTLLSLGCALGQGSYWRYPLPPR
ncbi:PAS domain S-box protein [Rubrobacter tropicus]|nr:PAS domain S-box protein [Rubrobacter tropicus]